jgi:hypothetical protein
MINGALDGRMALMLMSKKLKLGQPGTKRLVTQYGAQLVCVRCHYDAGHCNRFETIELKNVSYDGKPDASALTRICWAVSPTLVDQKPCDFIT